MYQQMCGSDVGLEMKLKEKKDVVDAEGHEMIYNHLEYIQYSIFTSLQLLNHLIMLRTLNMLVCVFP